MCSSPCWATLAALSRAEICRKLPVRLWLFGLVSLLEMQLLRVVRVRYPAQAWTCQISIDRLEGARRVFADRQRRKGAT